MSSYNQNQPQVAYPAAAAAPGTQPLQVSYNAPPPAGYPTRDNTATTDPDPAPAKTQSRGDGFWKGCCAALCCCCVLDACF